LNKSLELKLNQLLLSLRKHKILFIFAYQKKTNNIPGGMMYKKTSYSFLGLLLFLTVSTFSFFTGCEKKEVPKETVKTPAETTPQPVAEQPKVEEKKAPDLKGIYSGTIGGKSMTLKITEQTDSSFEGSVSMNFKDPINQKVKGKINLTTGEITMSDLLKQIYQGFYVGKMNSDFTTIAGTWSIKTGNQKFNFTIKKK